MNAHLGIQARGCLGLGDLVSQGFPGGGLAALQSDLSARLAEGGWYVPERRPYMAHVTVARVRRGATLRPMALPSPPPHAFTASRITLFRSRLSAAGARYEALAGVGLG